MISLVELGLLIICAVEYGISCLFAKYRPFWGEKDRGLLLWLIGQCASKAFGRGDRGTVGALLRELLVDDRVRDLHNQEPGWVERVLPSVQVLHRFLEAVLHQGVLPPLDISMIAGGVVVRSGLILVVSLVKHPLYLHHRFPQLAYEYLKNLILHYLVVFVQCFPNPSKEPQLLAHLDPMALHTED